MFKSVGRLKSLTKVNIIKSDFMTKYEKKKETTSTDKAPKKDEEYSFEKLRRALRNENLRYQLMRLDKQKKRKPRYILNEDGRIITIDRPSRLY